MNYVWNDHSPIAIHISTGDWSPESLQSLANSEDLPVRDYRENRDESYYPE